MVCNSIADDVDGLSFKVPIFFFQGADDLNTPTAPARDYYDRISAPVKKLVVLPDAGHLIIVFHDQILAFLNHDVRPLALRSASPRGDDKAVKIDVLIKAVDLLSSRSIGLRGMNVRQVSGTKRSCPNDRNWGDCGRVFSSRRNDCSRPKVGRSATALVILIAVLR